MASKPMRQAKPSIQGRPVGEQWRSASKYQLFDELRTDYIVQVTGYSKSWLTRIRKGRDPVPDRLVTSMVEVTGWSIERLFGIKFLEEWQREYPDAE